MRGLAHQFSVVSSSSSSRLVLAFCSILGCIIPATYAFEHHDADFQGTLKDGKALLKIGLSLSDRQIRKKGVLAHIDGAFLGLLVNRSNLSKDIERGRPTSLTEYSAKLSRQNSEWVDC